MIILFLCVISSLDVWIWFFLKNDKLSSPPPPNFFIDLWMGQVKSPIKHIQCTQAVFAKKCSPNENIVNLIYIFIYITVPKRWCQCLGLFHWPKNSIRCHQFCNAQPLCRFIVPYQISCSKRVWHGWIWSIPLSSPNPKGPSMFLPNNFTDQIYWSNLPVKFTVVNFLWL